MPDLTPVPTYTCASNDEWGTEVTGSKGSRYTVRFTRLSGRARDMAGVQHGWTCTCRAFEFRGSCKHIDQVKAEGSRCGWNWELEPRECGRDSEGRPCCPACGGPVIPLMVGI